MPLPGKGTFQPLPPLLPPHHRKASDTFRHLSVFHIAHDDHADDDDDHDADDNDDEGDYDDDDYDDNDDDDDDDDDDDCDGDGEGDDDGDGGDDDDNGGDDESGSYGTTFRRLFRHSSKKLPPPSATFWPKLMKCPLLFVSLCGVFQRLPIFH